ncbi:MAG: plastocyanin/azurin family copper-binding protein [Nitrosopumilaceae archaeon]
MNLKIFLIVLLLSISISLLSNFELVFAEEFQVTIPFGAYNPELNTPAEVWYDPPTISVMAGDTITWYNDDREGHTVTSGEGSGRFGWMGDDFGTPDGLFDSGRFMPGESWSLTFDNVGTFRYFCTIHPWMEGFVIIESVIPDYPHDASGKKLKFPILQVTPDRSVEINFSWDPKVIKTHEKVDFIYRFYDAVNDLPLRKLQYDIIIIQNGKEFYRDENTVSGAGGDYRRWIFEEPGLVIVKFRNIQSFGAVGGTEITLTENPVGRIGDFSAMVYENPEKTQTTEKIVQPKETFQFYYEFAVMIIVVPAIMLLGLVIFMKRKKPLPLVSGKKSTPI